MITIEGLSILDAENQVIVRDVSLDLGAGRCLAIVGESGAGKTLTAKSLLGLLPEGLRSEAELFHVFEQDAKRFSVHDWRSIRGRRVGFIVQEALAALDPLRKIGHEVSEPLEIHGVRPKVQHKARVLELLEQQQIPDPVLRAQQYSHELSGGQRQRALIASVLAGEPQVIIADEPTASLDTILAARQLDILAELKAQGFAVVLISHDLAAVAQLADDVIVMKAGRVVEQGSAAQVLQYPKSEYTQRLLASARHEELNSRAQLTSEDSRAALEATNLGKRYGSSGNWALRSTDVTLRQGEVLGVAGESGSGKSTLAKLLLAAEKPSTGVVKLFGQDWSELSEGQRRGRRHLMQWVPQDPLSSFDPRWRIRRILLEALQQRSVAVADRDTALKELLAQVELSPEILKRRPRELSGGQRQRIAIARALALNPKILICDEAVSALDVTIQATILQLLDRLRRELQLSIVFISHDLGVIRNFSDRVIVLKDGVVVEQGDTATVLESPQHPYTQQLLAASLHLFTD